MTRRRFNPSTDASLIEQAAFQLDVINSEVIALQP